jgi:hypothetical protein
VLLFLQIPHPAPFDAERGCRIAEQAREGFIVCSAISLLFQVFRLPSASQRDLGGGALDVAEIVGREFDGNYAKVLLQASEPASAGDGAATPARSGRVVRAFAA